MIKVRPPSNLLEPRAHPTLRGATPQDFTAFGVECVGIIDLSNEDKASILTWLDTE